MASPASSDEGEIVDKGVSGGDSKANSLPQMDEIGVDRPDRLRVRHSASSSPDQRHGYANGSKRSHSRGAPERPSRSRSRSPRGHKRARDDRDYHSHNGCRPSRDPRRFRVHYEDAHDDIRRSRHSQKDYSNSSSLGAGLRYDDRDEVRERRDWIPDRSRDRDRDRDRYFEKRPRNRTRSPYRPPRGPPGRGGGGSGSDRRREQGRSGKNDAGSPRHARNGNHGGGRSDHGRQDTATSHRASFAEKATPSQDDAKVDKGNVDQDDQEAVEEQQEVDIIDEETEIERRRRRREELLAKVRPTPMLKQVLQAAWPAQLQNSTPQLSEAHASHSAASSPSSPGPGLQGGISPAALEISNDQELINTHGKSRDADEDGPSAADYDPTADMREDEKRDEMRHGHVGPRGEMLLSEEKAELETAEGQVRTSTEAREDDDDFDMFAEDFDEEKFAAPKPVALASAATEDQKMVATLAQGTGGGILEGDDKDGYYKIRIGEILNGRYQVQATLGKGMFSGVARAMDIMNKQLVAIKMMRNNDALRKGGFTEIAILQKLNESDPENRRHIVKFERHFEHKGHLCLAFENLSLNLREVLRKFGNNVGINLNATRAYAHQMFVALAHMRKCTIIHADLKPDNILVNETRNVLKICDLGTAIDRSDAATAHNAITPYLISRFYRAPEIMLGMSYDYAVDMWSTGCTLYELYTGKILFTGDSNNQMLKTIIEIRGKFSPKLYKRGQLSHMHFDDMGNFISVEQDKTLGKTVVRILPVVKPTRDLRTRITAASGGMSDAESRELNQFIDLLERCLALNPDKRITPAEALKHPFFLAKAAGGSGNGR